MRWCTVAAPTPWLPPGDRQYAASSTLILAQAHGQLGNYRKAWELSNKAHALNDSTNLEANREEINFLRLQQQEAETQNMAQLAQANEALAAANAANAAQVTQGLVAALVGLALLLVLAVIIWINRQRQVKLRQQVASQNQALTKADADKAVLLKEIHHRVKNNLQVVSSLLSMQSREVSDPAALDAVQEGQSRVKSIALIHQKLYQNDNLSQVDFQDYTEQLVAAIANTFEHGQSIQKSIKAEGVALDIDTAIPIGLILNELVSNAYKYAFAGAAEGKLNVELKRLEDGTCELRVADTGQGLPENFEPLKNPSLGMKIIDGLTRQLNGSLQHWNEGGAVFSIRFKEKAVS